jgi:predicted HTH domain antitoxin
MLYLEESFSMPATLHFDWDLPEGALREPFAQDLVDTIKREATLRLFAEGKISSGYAAKMLGMPRQEFLDLAGERHIPLTAYGPGDLAAETAVLDQFVRDRRTE